MLWRKVNYMIFRPKYDYKTGAYRCPGFRDDEDYTNCNRGFTKEELKRDPWE